MKNSIKHFWPLLLVNSLAILSFSILFISQKNYEFILYILVIVFFFAIIFKSLKHIPYSSMALWGLTIWGILHMAGGGIIIDGHVLYAQMIYEFSEHYKILKYDQIVHAFGFFVATVVMYEIIKPQLKEKITGWIAISIVIIMAGLGAGALNEIIEFAATELIPETNVGGYLNTSLDLISNLIGASIAMIVIYKREKLNK